MKRSTKNITIPDVLKNKNKPISGRVNETLYTDFKTVCEKLEITQNMALNVMMVEFVQAHKDLLCQ